MKVDKSNQAGGYECGAGRLWAYRSRCDGAEISALMLGACLQDDMMGRVPLESWGHRPLRQNR